MPHRFVNECKCLFNFYMQISFGSQPRIDFSLSNNIAPFRTLKALNLLILIFVSHFFLGLLLILLPVDFHYFIFVVFVSVLEICSNVSSLLFFKNLSMLTLPINWSSSCFMWILHDTPQIFHRILHSNTFSMFINVQASQ